MNRTGRPAASSNGSHSIESVVATVRTLWSAAEGAAEAEKVKLKRDITQTVTRLKNRVEGRLSKPVVTPRKEPMLFEVADAEPISESEIVIPLTLPRFAEPVLRVYAKDFADHAVQHLPQAVKYRSVEDFRNYLAEKLRFNSQSTRRRSANYIVSRFFPGEVYNDDLPLFAAATAGQPALGDALFYLTCRAEKIVSLVAEEVVFPSLAQGGVSRTRIREYVQSKFPQSKSAVRDRPVHHPQLRVLWPGNGQPHPSECVATRRLPCLVRLRLAS